MTLFQALEVAGGGVVVHKLAEDGPQMTLAEGDDMLAPVLVELVDSAVCREEKGLRVWTQMKSRTLDDIRLMYEARQEDHHVALQHPLILNANLDLNRAET
jgi:hypothetical protein